MPRQRAPHVHNLTQLYSIQFLTKRYLCFYFVRLLFISIPFKLCRMLMNYHLYDVLLFLLMTNLPLALQHTTLNSAAIFLFGGGGGGGATE